MNANYNRLLLLVSGLGGLLYGIDVGIISGALPYLEATSNLSSNQLSFVVAAVLLGGVISTLFAGMLADWMGRRTLMLLSGVMFSLSIPMIALSQGYHALVLGRLLQGVSAGLIGVVVPLYLAECLGASNRGKGTGVFQWMLTAGLVFAAGISTYFSYRVETVARLGDANALFLLKDHAWRSIFWLSLPCGLLFVAGCFVITESPRWLLRHRGEAAARKALGRSRTGEQVETEMKEMVSLLAAESGAGATGTSAGAQVKQSLLRRKYILPFVLACSILAFNQLTGIDSMIAYNTSILLQGGLSDIQAHWGSLGFNVINFLATMIGVVLVDRKGRKFLLALGTGGIVVSVAFAALFFRGLESQKVDIAAGLRPLVGQDQTLKLHLDQAGIDRLLREAPGGAALAGRPVSLVINYAYGDFHFASKVLRTTDTAPQSLEIVRNLPGSKIEAMFSSSSPFGDLEQARVAPLQIETASVIPLPSPQRGFLLAGALYVFMAFYALGPGVCVWLALSELMPTRIRSNGMSIALLMNRVVSTGVAAVFLPVTGKYGYSAMFLLFAVGTAAYFLTVVLALPETKGKTLEEIEAHFEGSAA